MFVILVWNQTGGQPRVADDTIYDNLADAVEDAAGMTERAKPRWDRYTVHELGEEIGGEG